MPEIGRANSDTPNPFAEVGMAPRRVASGSNEKKTVGNELNALAGNKVQSGVKFVDGKKHNQLGQNEFMKLLTVQLANQDPMNPVDQKKLSGDLAQFSQLEQLTNMNNKLDKLGSNASPELKYYGASFLGKRLATRGTTIDYKGEGNAVRIPFELPQVGKNVIARISDEKGQVIGEIPAQNLPAGPNTLTWSGRALDGQDAGKGMYTVSVIAFDEMGNKIDAKTKTEGIVTGVNFDNGETILEVDSNRRVFLRDVESFSLSDAPKVPVNKVMAQKYANGEETAKQ
ncbi:MAG: flagellar hook assembly protein FlgD [Bdellovibrio sp.]|nr:flagellar hook assembly protein FlgD [Bdellovibrio sp.]